MLPRMKTPSSSFLQLPNGKQNNKPGPQLNKHATNRAELKCNRCCCSWTRLGAGSEPLWLAAAPGTLSLQRFLCRTTAFSLHRSLFLFLRCAFSLLSSSPQSIPSACPTWLPHFIPTSCSSLHHFWLLTLKPTDFISEKLKRRGKATSMNFLDHFSTGEYNNYFSPFLFSCSDPMQRPALSPHQHTVSARMLNATSQFLQTPSLMVAVQVPVGCSWAHMRSPPQKCCPSSCCSPKSLAYL